MSSGAFSFVLLATLLGGWWGLKSAEAQAPSNFFMIESGNQNPPLALDILGSGECEYSSVTVSTPNPGRPSQHWELVNRTMFRNVLTGYYLTSEPEKRLSRHNYDVGLWKAHPHLLQSFRVNPNGTITLLKTHECLSIRRSVFAPNSSVAVCRCNTEHRTRRPVANQLWRLNYKRFSTYTPPPTTTSTRPPTEPPPPPTHPPNKEDVEEG